MAEKPPNKGKINDECYRAVCITKPATWYNHSTRMYYCSECAHLINMANLTDAMRMYGHLLCTDTAAPESQTKHLSDLTSFGHIMQYLLTDPDITAVFEVRDLELHIVTDQAYTVKNDEDLQQFARWHNEGKLVELTEISLFQLKKFACDAIRLEPYYFVKNRQQLYK